VRLLLRLWRLLPRRLQLAGTKAVQHNHRLYRWVLFRHVDAKDRANGVKNSLPPAELRYRVSSTPDAAEFVATGKRCAGDIQNAVARVGRDLGSFNRILDFGCGCGRTLIHLKDRAPNADLHGTDIDAKAIEWCRRHLPFAGFKVSSETPPVDYAADSFDLIYAISVFTHLDESYQFRWLEELRRIARPGAIVLLTVDSSLVGDQEFVFQRSYEEGLFPAWYQNAYHSREYVVDNFGRYFSILDYLVKGMNKHQDIVILQKV
jgi:trans-aconitate methyltransferase